MEITRRRLLRDGIGAGVALTVGSGPLSSALAAAAKPAAAPYALGFRSLTKEIRLPDVPVEGHLPRWLRGVLLRNGPALFEIGDTQLNHWFDGLAMLHAFAFGDGRVSYANRFLRSSAYEAWRAGEGMKYSEFGTDPPDPDPCREVFRAATTLPVLGPVPNANVSIEQLARSFQAHTELPVPVRFDPRKLKTLGGVGTMAPGRLGTAHPHRDRRRRERLSYELELIPPGGLRIISERRGTRRELAFIPQERPGYLHSFGLTRRYVVVFTQPWEFDLARFLSPDRGPIASSFVWDGSKPSRVILVDRHRGGVAAEFELEPAFVFHHINAFDDGERVVADVCAHRDSRAVDSLYLDKLRSPGSRVPQGVARRLTLNPGNGGLRSRDLAPGNIELPRINYGMFNSRPYRYVYGVGVRSMKRSGFIDQLVKLDVKRGERRQWDGHGSYPGEPIFVRRPGGRREDDGVLLSVVLDAKARSSFLLVLDARDLSELARAQVPHHIPFGFHGLHSNAV